MPIRSEAGRLWISTKTSQTVSLEDFCITISEPASFVDLGPTSRSGLGKLPDEFETRELLNAYLMSPFNFAFPILDEVLLESTIQSAYSESAEISLSTTQLSTTACLLATISMASYLNLSQQISTAIDAHTCAAQANSLLIQAMGDISLTTLQTILLLQLRFMFNGHWKKANMFNSMACSMICSLGGHIHEAQLAPRQDLSIPEREARHIRVLFWVSYMLDKDISLRTGNPPLLTDSYCDLTFPENYLEYDSYLPGRRGSVQSSDQISGHLIPHFPGDLKLSLLKEKVCRHLFSAQALKNDNNQLLLNIRQLDDEIESWRLSIPLHFRPALFVSQSSPLNTMGECSLHFNRLISLQLEYHHLMTIIHTTVRKCIPGVGDGYRDLHHVVHSSFDLSLEASRSTIWCIKVLCTKDTADRSRLIVSYLTTAAMSLFLNIIIHPLDHMAQMDLETMISVANTICNTHGNESTQGERCRLQETSDFVMRLVWLGTCAVTKARRE
ncbi:unnamed protein product [Penicillium salamii]|uniref:Xylanolytic transcriptional activator regulatory domain-containing protein n=1 Tax=Penicillium salamii TaxID=1612424 RepID=A0A9W4NHM9_9EURO|nr:unnamed protein product [Penicillium salamii]CAG8052766.1 unnamed protein product [Penicillium salamii]CAG8200848.1 unnamed protein product [Penicillium salamii]CAG8367732.1 unnamed protein product [Penicillium salamii]CAG8368033.1 unnamed protein product [Penicillium salamii]